MGKSMAFTLEAASTPTIVNSSVERTREYLAGNEVEKLIISRAANGRCGIVR
jgi:hypothetical protein